MLFWIIPKECNYIWTQYCPIWIRKRATYPSIWACFLLLSTVFCNQDFLQHKAFLLCYWITPLSSCPSKAQFVNVYVEELEPEDEAQLIKHKHPEPCGMLWGTWGDISKGLADRRGTLHEEGFSISFSGGQGWQLSKSEGAWGTCVVVSPQKQLKLVQALLWYENY